MSSPSIAFVSVTLHIPHAGSLKDKRRYIKSIKDKLHNQFNASVAEIDKQDKWQQAVIGIVMLSSDRVYLEQQYSRIEQMLGEYRDVVVSSLQLDWL